MAVLATFGVKEGVFLILLDDKDFRAAVDQAEGALVSTQARFRQIQESTLPTKTDAALAKPGRRPPIRRPRNNF